MAPSADRTAALVITAVALVLLWDISTAPARTAMLPQAVLALSMLLALAMFLRSFFRRAAPSDAAETPAKKKTFFIDPHRFLIGVAATAIYIVAIEPLGFYAASALFVLGAAYALGERRLPVLLGTTVAFLLFAYLVFSVLLERPLPRGYLTGMAAERGYALAVRPRPARTGHGDV